PSGIVASNYFSPNYGPTFMSVAGSVITLQQRRFKPDISPEKTVQNKQKNLCKIFGQYPHFLFFPSLLFSAHNCALL
ncbi:TPA: hypothetical protein ACH72Y_004675, partial [Escherichia coli]